MARATKPVTPATFTHIGGKPHVGYAHCGSRLYGHIAPQPGRSHALNVAPDGRGYRALCGERIASEYHDDGGYPVRDHVSRAEDGGKVHCKRCRKAIGQP